MFHIWSLLLEFSWKSVYSDFEVIFANTDVPILQEHVFKNEIAQLNNVWTNDVKIWVDTILAR